MMAPKTHSTAQNSPPASLPLGMLQSAPVSQSTENAPTATPEQIEAARVAAQATAAAAEAAKKAVEAETLRKKLCVLTSERVRQLLVPHEELHPFIRLIKKIREETKAMWEMRCDQDDKDTSIWRYTGMTQKDKRKQKAAPGGGGGASARSGGKTTGDSGGAEESKISEEVLKKDIRSVFTDLLTVVETLNGLGITPLDVSRFYAENGLHQEWDVVLCSHSSSKFVPFLELLKDTSKMEGLRQAMETHCRAMRFGSAMDPIPALGWKPNDKNSYGQGGFNRYNKAVAFDIASKSSLDFIYPLAGKWLGLGPVEGAGSGAGSSADHGASSAAAASTTTSAATSNSTPTSKDCAILGSLFIISFILFNRWEIIGQGNAPQFKDEETCRDMISPEVFGSFFNVKEPLESLIQPIDEKDFPLLLLPVCFHVEVYPIAHCREYQHNKLALKKGDILLEELRGEEEEEEDGDGEPMEDGDSDGDEEYKASEDEGDDDDDNSSVEEVVVATNPKKSSSSSSKKTKRTSSDSGDEDEEEEEDVSPKKKARDALEEADAIIERDLQKAKAKKEAKKLAKLAKKAARKAEKQEKKKKTPSVGSGSGSGESEEDGEEEEAEEMPELKQESTSMDVDEVAQEEGQEEEEDEEEEGDE